MSTRRRNTAPDADIAYFHDLLKSLSKDSVYDAKAVLLLCKCLYPNSFKVKIIEYELSKMMENHKQAATLLSEIATADDSFLKYEIHSIVSNLMASAPDTFSQKLFMALPNRLQHDFITRFCWESFSDATSQADFLLRFIRDKAEDLNANHLIAPLCEFLIKMLMDAEVEHWQSCEKATVEVPTMTPVAQKKPPAPLPTRKAPKSPSSGQPEEGEEGEVIEADEDEGEELDEDSENGAEDIKSSVQTLHKVLNVYRMILAADLFPVIHRMRNTIKLAVPQLQTLVINSFQFLLTFAAHIPFASTAEPFPAVSGLQKPLPCLLQQEPRRYLRLYLDMACALLKWPVVGSFQGQSHDDLMESLLECIRVYENAGVESSRDGQHQKSRKRHQRGAAAATAGAASASGLKPPPVSAYAAANEAACIFWSLLIEVGLKYAQSCNGSSSLLPLSPSNILPVGGGSTTKPQTAAVDNECLLFLHKLFALQQVFEGQSAPPSKKSRGGGGDSGSRSEKAAGSILQVMHASLRPQDLAVFSAGASSLPKFMFESCLLERFLRLHLALAGLFDSSGAGQVFCWADEVVGVANALATEDTQSPAAAASSSSSSSQFVLPYRRADLLRLHCLIDAARVSHAALPDQRTVEQGACFEKLFNLLEAVDTSAAASEALIDINSEEGLVHLQISSDLQVLGILELALKLWLYARLRETRQPTTDKQLSVDAALLIMILHQSTAWSKLLVQLNSEMLQELMKVIKADWTVIRTRILAWLKSGFIVDVSLLTQLVHIESESGPDPEESELVKACLSRIQNPPNKPIVLLLADFIKAEAANIRVCLGLQYNFVPPPP